MCFENKLSLVQKLFVIIYTRLHLLNIHRDTSVFFNLELNCDSSEQFENVLCS